MSIPPRVGDLVAVGVLGGEAHTGTACHRARPAGQRGIRTEGRQHRLLHFDALVTCSSDNVGRQWYVVWSEGRRPKSPPAGRRSWRSYSGITGATLDGYQCVAR